MRPDQSPPARPPIRRALFALVLAWLLAGLSVPASHAQSDLAPASPFADTRPDAAAPAAPAAPAFGGDTIGYHLNIRGGFDHLARFIVPNAQTATVVGPQAANIYGIDYDGQRIWGLNQDTLQLGTLSEDTAVFTPTVSITGIPTGQSLVGLTIGPDGTFYVGSAVAGTSTLSTLDPATGVLTPIGNIANATLLIALAMNCDGVLYGHDIGSDSILRIPADNPAGTTVVGATGQNANFAQGMDFDDETGTLYAWLYRGTGAGDFVTINTTTGAATVVTALTGEFEGFIKTTCDAVVTITSPPPAAGQYGQPYSHTFTASSAGTPTFALSGTLPPGLSFLPTGLITGTPTLAGVYPNLSVSVAGSPQATQAFTLTIAKAPLTARAVDASRRVGQANPPFTIAYTGFVGADTAAVLAVPPVAQSAATPASPVGTYPITVAGGSDENYAFTYQSGTLTVGNAAIYLPLLTRPAAP